MIITVNLSFLSIGILQGSRQMYKEQKKLKILDKLTGPLTENWG
tara:strand:+ start:344 stop:475 length:132 start_codon:yes stop_codon:yes gene_type:complete